MTLRDRDNNRKTNSHGFAREGEVLRGTDGGVRRFQVPFFEHLVRFNVLFMVVAKTYLKKYLMKADFDLK